MSKAKDGKRPIQTAEESAALEPSSKRARLATSPITSAEQPDDAVPLARPFPWQEFRSANRQYLPLIGQGHISLYNGQLKRSITRIAGQIGELAGYDFIEETGTKYNNQAKNSFVNTMQPILADCEQLPFAEVTEEFRTKTIRTLNVALEPYAAIIADPTDFSQLSIVQKIRSSMSEIGIVSSPIAHMVREESPPAQQPLAPSPVVPSFPGLPSCWLYRFPVMLTPQLALFGPSTNGYNYASRAPSAVPLWNHAPPPVPVDDPAISVNQFFASAYQLPTAQQQPAQPQPGTHAAALLVSRGNGPIRQ